MSSVIDVAWNDSIIIFSQQYSWWFWSTFYFDRCICSSMHTSGFKDPSPATAESKRTNKQEWAIHHGTADTAAHEDQWPVYKALLQSEMEKNELKIENWRKNWKKWMEGEREKLLKVISGKHYLETWLKMQEQVLHQISCHLSLSYKLNHVH